ncbi:hypothetical protein GMRT_24499 [Giardia muris]|uniref:Uncharacterized protein n=1 Tax=Giardia muris TaxID=5742 RepID=A0A4Z1T1K8_GIAMU|nr:hypothetical protein GMRT_24499 [Giardia muris]|eukprot:TNJ26241.1 hypothetical protein GMRT_24499 [Giardia muris]
MWQTRHDREAERQVLFPDDLDTLMEAILHTDFVQRNAFVDGCRDISTRIVRKLRTTDPRISDAQLKYCILTQAVVETLGYQRYVNRCLLESYRAKQDAFRYLSKSLANLEAYTDTLESRVQELETKSF